MSPSNERVHDPTERTSLLSKNSNGNRKPIDVSSSDEITADGSQSSDGHESIFKGGDGDVVDEETGEVEEDDNPLFEGNPDINMKLLFPAVALGVSTFCL